MTDILLWVLFILVFGVLVLLGFIVRRLLAVSGMTQAAEVGSEAWRSDIERLESRLRVELQETARSSRQEFLATLSQFQQSLLGQGSDAARTQREQLQALSDLNERRLSEVRATLDQQLAVLQQGNERKLEQMRMTVDEKLHATLEQRLGESFKHVSDRLEQVHRGLGEMQNLAKDVGSLNRVLNNVKTRGIFGEVRLAALLEQVFTPDQYGTNVEVVPAAGRRVEFAIKLPGRQGFEAPLWLPLDAKFPREDYERLLEAQERADVAAMAVAAKSLEQAFKRQATDIRAKYVCPPHTTDFAILFVPMESLYAEALRCPGLVEWLQQENRVMLAGPTTLLAILNSLLVGFRTLALEQRSMEVWEVLGAVKNEFEKFGQILAKTKKKLEEASNVIESAEQRTRVMGRRLKSVEALPDARSQALLEPDGALLEEGEDAASLPAPRPDQVKGVFEA